MTIDSQALRSRPLRDSFARLLPLIRDPSTWVIFGSAGSLVGTMAVTSVFGFAYWWVAARFFEAPAVGFAAAAISAMNLLGSLAMLGFGTLLIGEIPKHRGHEWTFINTVLYLTGGAGLVLGLGFALVAPLLSHDLAPLRAGAGSVSFFALGVALTSATNVLDLALVGMLRGSVQFWRNVLFALSKLLMVAALPFLISRGSTTGIYVAWTLGNVVSLAVVAWPLLADGVSLSAFVPKPALLHGLRASAALHHVQNLALQMATLVLPLIVIAMLSAEANAYFYIIWLLAGFVFVPPFALSLGLYTIGAREPQRFARHMRVSSAVAAAFGLVAVLVAAVAAGPLLSVFGHDYSANGGMPLRLVVLGVFPLIVKDHYVACCRVQNRIVGASVVLALGSTGGLAAAALGAALDGLSGVVLGWLIAEALQVLVFLPTVLRAAFPRAGAYPPPRS